MYVYIEAFLWKFYKIVKALPCRAICEIKHLVHDLSANKALSFTSCFISLSATCLLLYFTYSTCGNALTYTESDITENFNSVAWILVTTGYCYITNWRQLFWLCNWTLEIDITCIESDITENLTMLLEF